MHLFLIKFHTRDGSCRRIHKVNENYIMRTTSLGENYLQNRKICIWKASVFSHHSNFNLWDTVQLWAQTVVDIWRTRQILSYLDNTFEMFETYSFMTFVINLCPNSPLLQIGFCSNTAIERLLVQQKKLKLTV